MNVVLRVLVAIVVIGILVNPTKGDNDRHHKLRSSRAKEEDRDEASSSITSSKHLRRDLKKEGNKGKGGGGGKDGGNNGNDELDDNDDDDDGDDSNIIITTCPKRSNPVCEYDNTGGDGTTYQNSCIALAQQPNAVYTSGPCTAKVDIGEAIVICMIVATLQEDAVWVAIPYF